MIIIPAQCRAARGLLGWSQQDLSCKAEVARKTIADFELGLVNPYPRTLRDVVAAFDAGGIEFTSAVDGVHGPGVRLKWCGVENARVKETSMQA